MHTSRAENFPPGGASSRGEEEYPGHAGGTHRAQLLIALAPAWLAFVWWASKAQWFWRQRADLHFGWIVLAMTLYLFYEQWKKRPALHSQCKLSLAITAAAGISFLTWMQAFQAAFGMNAAAIWGLSLGLMTMVISNFWYLFGFAGLSRFLFVFSFALLALPLPSIFYHPVVGNLASLVTRMNFHLLQMAGVPADISGHLICLPGGLVGIDEACSGVRSLQASLIASAFIGKVAFRRISFRLALIGIGMGAAVAGNLARAFVVCAGAYWRGSFSTEIHDAAGWAILLFTILSLLGSAALLARIEARFTIGNVSPL